MAVPASSAPQTCVSNQLWRDPSGLSCAEYESQEICKDGGKGPAWLGGEFAE